MKSVGTSYIKDKFSTLLSKLVVDAKISYNQITDKLIESDFLDCFEKNNLSLFYDKSYEAIIFDLFKKETVYSEDTDPVVYWCGQQYMNLFLNKRIPLKQLFVLCSLREMEKYYEIYHEQNPSKFIDVFMENEYKNSILKLIRNKRNYTLRELSVLTDISINTLKYYEENENLYKASYSNVEKIINILEFSDSIIKRKSSYVPSFLSLLEDNEIRTYFEEFINNYYNTNEKVQYSLNSFSFAGKHKKIIDKKVVDSAILYSIDKYDGDKLIF